MGKKIILVGCGNIGSRHLQALVKLPYDTEIHIVEPSKESKKLAQSRLDEVLYDKKNHIFFWHESIKELENKSDIVIVATPSVGRVNLINQLLELGHLRFLIEKVVCQSEEEYLYLLNRMKVYNAKGWVHTPKRCFKSYQKIKELLSDSNGVSLSVLATNYGLGSNAIHYIDLFSWLNDDYKIKLDGQFLLNELLPNKRGDNFKEFVGTITGSLTNGSFLSLSFLPSPFTMVLVNIDGKNMHFVIDETRETIQFFKGMQIKQDKFEYEHVSNLTTAIIDEILQNDSCSLPTLDDSFHGHLEIFRVLNTHLKKILNEDVKLCPIT